ncbi:hypothetical protein Tcan_00890, partial [Toxocara canis]
MKCHRRCRCIQQWERSSPITLISGWIRKSQISCESRSHFSSKELQLNREGSIRPYLRRAEVPPISPRASLYAEGGYFMLNRYYPSSEARKEYSLTVPTIFNDGSRRYSTTTSLSNTSTQRISDKPTRYLVSSRHNRWWGKTM